MVEPLFVKQDLALSSEILLSGLEAKHAISVRRMRIGEAIAVTNGSGLLIRGSVKELSKQELVISVTETVQEEPPALSFVLVQALAKGDRDELAIQAATELGVFEVIPWSADRSVSTWQGRKVDSGRERWQQIVTEAAKQSLRTFIPIVHAPVSSKELAKAFSSFDLVLVLDPTGTASLDAVKLPKEGRVAIVVGPEGGISPQELELFEAAMKINLGKGILRTSTAGPAALAALTLR
jgi:16S rRNA (uracil1498-N3)-methyltransferase